MQTVAINHGIRKMKYQLFTIGYCIYTLENFLLTLHSTGVNAIVDVRAAPEISHFKEYKITNIKPVLIGAGIHYLSFAREFGARPTDDTLYTAGQVDFGKLILTPQFREGCNRIKDGLDKGYKICLMCAQKDPLNCHRAVLLTHTLRKIFPDIGIAHIWPDHLESQEELDIRALKEYRKKNHSRLLWEKPAVQAKTELDLAYDFLGKKIAYSKD